MTTSRKAVAQDIVIEKVQELFQCRVLWSEGRPCLEYDSEEELARISDYVSVNFDTELLDVFFTAIESLPAES
ncbi:hypothetical protein ACE6ED_06150 [Paenibacillus sp. CN-4]|uniref:hypothetical protein n=1 Tax=Paenibacillus nanchangensis TaxID=3348343 RepID=UPI003979B8CB